MLSGELRAYLNRVKKKALTGTGGEKTLHSSQRPSTATAGALNKRLVTIFLLQSISFPVAVSPKLQKKTKQSRTGEHHRTSQNITAGIILKHMCTK